MSFCRSRDCRFADVKLSFYLFKKSFSASKNLVFRIEKHLVSRYTEEDIWGLISNIVCLDIITWDQRSYVAGSSCDCINCNYTSERQILWVQKKDFWGLAI